MPKSKAKSKASVGRSRTAKKPLPKTKVIGGRKRTKTSCHTTKTAASKAAKSQRQKGRVAAVVANPTGGYCVFTAAAKRRK